MLFKQKTLSEIKSGKVSLAFRKWKRPTVKTGGTLLTPVGKLSIDSVEIISMDQVKATDLDKAGIIEHNELIRLLGSKNPGNLYMISFHLLGDDPRIALRQNDQLNDAEINQILVKLKGFDSRSKYGDWTKKTLMFIFENPAVRASNIAESLQMEKAWLKIQIRKLKNLGLTISLPVGYQISKRGKKVLKNIK